MGTGLKLTDNKPHDHGNIKHFVRVRSKVIPPKHQQAPPSFVVYDHNEDLVAFDKTLSKCPVFVRFLSFFLSFFFLSVNI